MAIDLGTLSRKDLKKLHKDIEKALVDAEHRAKSEALKAAEKVVSEFGFTLTEVTSSVKGKGSTKGSKAAPKYRNPANPEQTWTGRGRKPAWIHEALSKGADVTDLEI